MSKSIVTATKKAMKKKAVKKKAVKKKAVKKKIIKKKVVRIKNKKITACFKRALLNISNYGDTDIFPYPVESKIFVHNEGEIINLLSKINGDVDTVNY